MSADGVQYSDLWKVEALVPRREMGVTGLCSGNFRTSGNGEKNDPFLL